jgi:hypothetical protein
MTHSTTTETKQWRRLSGARLGKSEGETGGGEAELGSTAAAAPDLFASSRSQGRPSRTLHTHGAGRTAGAGGPAARPVTATRYGVKPVTLYSRIVLNQGPALNFNVLVLFPNGQNVVLCIL